MDDILKRFGPLVDKLRAGLKDEKPVTKSRNRILSEELSAKLMKKPLNPRPDYKSMLESCKTVFERQKVFRAYYLAFEDHLFNNLLKGQWFNTYEIRFEDWFTPIEYKCLVRDKMPGHHLLSAIPRT